MKKTVITVIRIIVIVAILGLLTYGGFVGMNRVSGTGDYTIPPVVLLQPDHEQRHAQRHHARRVTTGRARSLTILNFTRTLAKCPPERV